MSRHIEAGRLGDSRTKARSIEVVKPRKKNQVPKRPTQQRAVERRLSPLQARVKEYLDAAYLRGQRKRDQSVRQELRSGLEGKKLLHTLMQSKGFGLFYEIAVKEALKGASWHKDIDRFRGALFQAVVLEHLKDTMQDSTQVLLTGKDVTKFIQLVNPGLTIIEYPYGQQAVDHRYVPDFLVLGLNNGKVGVEEYGEVSLVTDPDKYTPQLSGFLRQKSRLGPLMNKARFKIITPQINVPLAMPIINGIEYVDTESVSVTYPDFRRFTAEVSGIYRKTPNSLTLRQIRREAQSRMGEPQFYRQ